MRSSLGLRAVSLVGALILIAACGATEGSAAATSPGVSAPPSLAARLLWPAPDDPMERTAEAGLEPGPKEFHVNHAHSHLSVFVDGEPILVPAGIGINTEDPDVREFDEPDGSKTYGGIELCDQPCISPLHTHDQSGIIHTESENPEPNTLGQFFTEWGVALSQDCVGEHCRPTPITVYIDGEPYSGDPAAIELTDLKVIAIVIGDPPPVIPSTADFSNA